MKVRYVAEAEGAPIVSSKLLTPAECDEIVRLCDARVASGLDPDRTGYASVANEDFATEDLEVDTAPAVRAYLRSVALLPAVERIFGSAFGRSRIYACDDVFVVRYDAQRQRELARHVDGGDLSFMVALSARSSYAGGGTLFEGATATAAASVAASASTTSAVEAAMDGAVLHLEQGDVLAFPAKLFHRGLATTAGLRYLLVGCVSAGFPPHACARRSPQQRHSLRRRRACNASGLSPCSTHARIVDERALRHVCSFCYTEDPATATTPGHVDATTLELITARDRTASDS
jgi:hypothetical protein